MSLDPKQIATWTALAAEVSQRYRDEPGVEEERLATEAVPALLAELERLTREVESWRAGMMEVHAALPPRTNPAAPGAAVSPGQRVRELADILRAALWLRGGPDHPSWRALRVALRPFTEER